MSPENKVTTAGLMGNGHLAFENKTPQATVQIVADGFLDTPTLKPSLADTSQPLCWDCLLYTSPSPRD